MVPLPVPVLSVKIDAVSAFSNSARGPGGTVDPASTALVNLVETVWVSVRSASRNDRSPEVGSLVVMGPPGVLVPPENAMLCAEVVMTGTSLVPVIVIVIGTVVDSLLGA